MAHKNKTLSESAKMVCQSTKCKISWSTEIMQSAVCDFDIIGGCVTGKVYNPSNDVIEGKTNKKKRLLARYAGHFCREVTVIKLICKGTIEEAILHCAEAKLKLEQDLSHINGVFCT